jgi:hypothetical protein
MKSEGAASFFTSIVVIFVLDSSRRTRRAANPRSGGLNPPTEKTGSFKPPLLEALFRNP